MSLETLVRDHAYWSDRVRELKKAGEESASHCTRRERKPGMSEHQWREALASDDCIATVFKDWEMSRDPSGYGRYEQSFEEFWEIARCDGAACDSCQKVRDFKSERMIARKRLGSIRAAITRMGRAIAKREAAA